MEHLQKEEPFSSDPHFNYYFFWNSSLMDIRYTGSMMADCLDTGTKGWFLKKYILHPLLHDIFLPFVDIHLLFWFIVAS